MDNSRITLVVLIACVFAIATAQTDGSIRINPIGADPLYGTLEVYFSGTWGNIAYTTASQATRVAQVVCRGFVDQYKAANNIVGTIDYAAPAGGVASNYGKSTKPMWLSNLACNGDELGIQYCPGFSPATYSVATHNADLTVKCGLYCPLGYAGPGCNQTCLCPWGNGNLQSVAACGHANQGCARCTPSYYGELCSFFSTCCGGSSNGYCTAGALSSLCAGCIQNRYGVNCASACSCLNGGKCPPNEGNAGQLAACTCTNYSQFSGATCSLACSCTNGTCGPVSNACYTCNPGQSGVNCDIPCNCSNGICSTLASASSQCAFCNEGFVGTYCDVPCNCTNGHCGRLPTSDPNTCVACKPGNTGFDCNTPCACANGNCSTHPYEGLGSACATCNPGFVGPTCSVACPCTNGACSNSASVAFPTACTSCNTGFYGPTCLPCNCSAFPGTGVCSDGLSGTGECYPDGYYRIPTNPLSLTFGTAAISGTLKIWKGKAWKTLCLPLSYNNAIAVAFCGKMLEQAGVSDWLTSAVLRTSVSFTYPYTDTSLTTNTHYSSISCPTASTSPDNCTFNTPGINSCYYYNGALSVSCGFNSLSCPTGFYGPNCTLPCTCKNGYCNSYRDPVRGGQCNQCFTNGTNTWTGVNCDVPCYCQNGQCSGSSSCATCYSGYYGPNCLPCSCSFSQPCSSGITGDGRCYSSFPVPIRLLPDAQNLTVGIPQAYVISNWYPICQPFSFTTTYDANLICKFIFGNSASAPNNLMSTITLPTSSTEAYISSSCSALTTGITCLNTGGTAGSCSTFYYLNCTVPQPSCGNYILEAGETCDGGPNCVNCQCITDYGTTNSGTRTAVGCSPVPRNCDWQPWGPWSSCTAACGSVTRTRAKNPAVFGGLDCSGPASDARACNYSECSVSCNGGTSKPLSNCAAQLAARPSPCASAPPCAAFRKANCNPNPCNNCQVGYFVNGVPVDCTVKPRTLPVVPPRSTGGLGAGGGIVAPGKPAPVVADNNGASPAAGISLVNSVGLVCFAILSVLFLAF